MVRYFGQLQNYQLGRLGQKMGMRSLATVAIASPLFLASIARAQQALPPPPGISNSNELPSLTPVPPPQAAPLPPASVTPLPQESIYQAPAPVPPLMPGGISPQGVMPEIRSSYYQVVVPTRPEDFSTIANKMVSMGVRPDAIQARKAPIGPHLAVGPFVNLGEAESVSGFLRSGGMDARVFFQK